MGMIEFPRFRAFWKYAELRTNVLASDYDLLLSRANEIRSMSPPDRRSLKALASSKLTAREAEVLSWVSEGKTNQEIGVIVGASTGTIRKHVEHILSKLNVENRTTAAVVALQTQPSFAARSKKKWSRSYSAIIALLMEQLSQVLSDGCEIYDVITDLIA
jgi:DNA-binding CsgD family transcriptional regulator